MKAVVLVGGFGTRLRPLTLSTPKPMLPVGHVPMVENLVRMLAKANITEVVLGLGFRPEPFMRAFPDGECAGIALHYAVEPEPLDTAGAIKFAAESAGIDDTFIVANGDVLTDLDVTSLIDFHRRSHARATLHLTPVDDPSAYGVVVIDDDGRVRRFVEKPAPGTEPSRMINAGTYVFEPEVLDVIPSGRKVSVERETFPILVERGTLFAMATDDYWIDTGRPETYLKANLDVLDGRRTSMRVDMVEQGAEVDPGAEILHSLVSNGARIERGAHVVDSVILPGAHVSRGANVRSSLVMGFVGSDATITDCVIGSDGRVESNATMSHARVPDQSN
jgi:mannose-1-phosphate guanylyltransferase